MLKSKYPKKKKKKEKKKKLAALQDTLQITGAVTRKC